MESSLLGSLQVLFRCLIRRDLAKMVQDFGRQVFVARGCGEGMVAESSVPPHPGSVLQGGEGEYRPFFDTRRLFPYRAEEPSRIQPVRRWYRVCQWKQATLVSSDNAVAVSLPGGGLPLRSWCSRRTGRRSLPTNGTTGPRNPSRFRP